MILTEKFEMDHKYKKTKFLALRVNGIGTDNYLREFLNVAEDNKIVYGKTTSWLVQQI